MSDDWRRKLKAFKPAPPEPPPKAPPRELAVPEGDREPSMAELLGETGRRPLSRTAGRAARRPEHRDQPGVPLDLENMPDMEQLMAEAAAKPAPPEPPPEAPPPAVAVPLDTETMPAMDELLDATDANTISGPIIGRDSSGFIVAAGPGKQLHLPFVAFEDEQLEVGDKLLIELRSAGPFIRKIFRREQVRQAASHVPEVPLAGRGFIIDGSNICRGTGTGAASALAPLLALVIGLRHRGAEFICVFDANERHHLAQNPRERQAEAVYEALLRQAHERFVEVPGATSADEWLLRRADRRQWAVISNDHFNKPGDPWPRQYPWLQVKSQRLLPWEYREGRISVPTLRLTVPVAADPRDLLAELQALDNQ